MKRFPWFEVLLTIVVLSVSLYAALSDAQNLSLRWFTRDDAYYYFKVAQNISEGRGSTFDGVNPTNGYHPLWMLICIPIFALARFDLILPLRILLLVMSGLSAATSILLYRLVGRIFSSAIGAVTALIWAFSYDVRVIVYQQGLESGIAAFFLALFVYTLFEFENRWRKDEIHGHQIAVLALLAVLILLSRLDLVFLAALMGIWIIFRGHLLRYFLPLDIASIVVATLLAFIVRLGMDSYYQYTGLALTMIGSGLVVKIPTAFLLGLYQHSQLLRARYMMSRLFLAGLIGSGITGGLMLASLRLGLLSGSFARSIILWDLVFTTALVGLNRLSYMGLQGQPTTAHPDNGQPLAYLFAYGKMWIREGAIYYGILLGTLGIYMAWNRFTFGTAFPVSGQIKQWWASLPGRAYGGRTRDVLSFFGLNYTTDSNAWNPVTTKLGSLSGDLSDTADQWRYLLLMILLAAVLYVLLCVNRKKAKTAITEMSLIPLLGGACLQILYYNAVGYASHKEWYWITQLVLIILLFSLAVGMVFRASYRLPQRNRLAATLAVLVGLGMALSYWNNIHELMPYHYWKPDAPYIDVAPLVEKYTKPGSMIGLTGGGNVAYFIPDRTIVNMDGLINSNSYFQALQLGGAGAYLDDMGLDYVLANPEILDQQPYKGQFNAYLSPLGVYYGGKELMSFGHP